LQILNRTSGSFVRILQYNLNNFSSEKYESIQLLYLQALNEVLNCLPGQKEIDSCVQSVEESANRFNNPTNFETPVGSFKDAAQDLKNAAEDTNQAAGNIVGASRGGVHDVVLASSEYAKVRFKDRSQRRLRSGKIGT
jgi:hypothetical protein